VDNVFQFVSYYIYYGLVLIQLVVNCFAEKKIVTLEHTKVRTNILLLS